MALVDVVSFTVGLVAEADTVAAAATAAAKPLLLLPPLLLPPPLLVLLLLILLLVKFVLGLAGADGRELLAPGLTSIFFMEVEGDEADEDKPAFLLLDELALNDENIPVQTMLVIIFDIYGDTLSIYVL